MRGREIGMVFQDPLTSLNPLYTVGQQLIETIQTHTDLDSSGRPQARDRAARGGRHPGAEQRIDPTRTSSPAACASAW
jgi:peptide/nickel transport system ATP-binding protein